MKGEKGGGGESAEGWRLEAGGIEEGDGGGEDK
jgi:hypothetical protein